jgi:hypothetical protein
MANPWMTSAQLIEAVKRKISYPLSQNTFTDADVLKFANEEMYIQQVPSIMEVHEEYFTVSQTVPLVSYQSRYEIPERAIGLKLRDLFYIDNGTNLMEMTRISSEDKAYFQANLSMNSSVHKFYFEGNDVVLSPSVGAGPNGNLLFIYYLRPNEIVTTDRASTITGFSKNVTINTSLIVANDTIIIEGTTFTAVTGSPAANEFQIGVNDIATATNLVNALTTAGFTASNGSPATSNVSIVTDNVLMSVTSDSAGLVVGDPIVIQFDQIPSNITALSLVDIIQKKSGHKTRAIDVKVPAGSISGNSIAFPSSSIEAQITDGKYYQQSMIINEIPRGLVVGDFFCTSGECIIPQIPSDLHTVLADRTAARILSSIGDRDGLADLQQRLAQSEHRTTTMIDNRAEGSPKKVTSRHSLLRYMKQGPRRRI